LRVHLGSGVGSTSKNGHRALRPYDDEERREVHRDGIREVSMAEKRKSRTAVVSEGAAQSVLRRAVAPELSSEEEKVMRMRLGATPPRTARLERAVEGDEELEIELRAIEIEAFMKWKAHVASRRPAAVEARPAPAARPASSRTKEKIVRALRKLN
jgi:hypothetical protein